MTDPITSRSLLPPDPFASDHTVHLDHPISEVTRSLLPPDPFERISSPRIDHAVVAQSMAATIDARTVTPSIANHLDATRDAYSGPYQILGETVTAQPQFRMSGGHNHGAVFTTDQPNQQDQEAFKQCLTPKGREVYGILARAGIGNPGGVMLGYGTPKDLVKATQALYFAGKLPLMPAPATLADRVRQMQWENGIGVDCVDYCMTALAQAKGRSVDGLGLQRGVDPFGAAGTTLPRHFARVDAASVRPGDIVALGDPNRVGHRAIVRDHAVVGPSDPKRADVIQHWGHTAASFFKGSGPFHVYAVDSSWSGDNGQPYGGYRSDTWVYSESSKLWMSCSHHESDRGVLVSPDGPAGERFVSGYRYGAT